MITHLIRIVMALCKQLRRITNPQTRQLFSSIKEDDVIYRHPNSDYMAVRLRSDHIPLIVPIIREFINRHSTDRHTSTKCIETFLEKTAKDPVSYFLINENFGKRAEAIFLQETAARTDVNWKKLRNEEQFHQIDFLKRLNLAHLQAENTFFSMKPHLNKVLHSKMTYTTTGLKNHGLADLMTLIGVTENSEVNSPIHDVTYCMAVTCGRRYVGGLQTYGYEMGAQLPRISPFTEAFLVYLDLQKAEHWKLRQHWMNVEHAEFIRSCIYALP